MDSFGVGEIFSTTMKIILIDSEGAGLQVVSVTA